MPANWRHTDFCLGGFNHFILMGEDSRLQSATVVEMLFIWRPKTDFMDLERYAYETKQTYKEFFFYSEGPKGRIRKVVRFVLMRNCPSSTYNLVLGDWNEVKNKIDDKVITNNGDTEKVLATVAMIVFVFTDILRNATVHVKGIDARARLYQISINKYWNEIKEMLYVSGYANGQSGPFQKNITYDGFLINRDRYLIGPKENFILEEQIEIYMTSQKKNQVEKRIYNDRVIDGPDEVDDNDPYIRRKTEEAEKALAELGFGLPVFFLKPEDEQQE
jgi:hypothetical protein